MASEERFATMGQDRARRPIGGWFTSKIMGRLYTKNNVLILVTGQC